MEIPPDLEQTSCFCGTNPRPVTDQMTGETACGKCGKVLVTRTENDQLEAHSSFIGNNVSSTKISGNARMKRASQMANNVDHTGINASSMIMACCAKLGLPTVIKASSISFFNKHRINLRGRNTNTMVAAVIYISCRENAVSRSMAEICDVLNADVKATRKAFKAIHNARGVPLPVQTSNGFVTRLASDLGMSEKMTRKALDLLSRTNEAGIMVGRHPVLLAACVLYIVSFDNDLGISQNKVADAAGITAVGLRLPTKKIRRTLGIPSSSRSKNAVAQ